MITEKETSFEVSIFERGSRPGCGFPYGKAGAGWEHVTNVSANEIPALIEPLFPWVDKRKEEAKYKPHLPPQFSDFNVVPRLLFGDYLSDQFEQYVKAAREAGIIVDVHLNSTVTAIEELNEGSKMRIITNLGNQGIFDVVILCTGHQWPASKEGKIENHFDSPYPTAKLERLVNMPVVIKGSSLTAVDAIRTIARCNGAFSRNKEGVLCFLPDPAHPLFTLKMRSLDGLLPGLRFHLEDAHLSDRTLLSKAEIKRHREANDGFVSLDYLFEENFKKQFEKTDPVFFRKIQPWTMEEFIGAALASFSASDPFALFAEEYKDSLASIRDKKSEYWKEKLAILSVSMNFPAKYLSAGDTIRLHEHLMPLISLVIAFVPQSSAEEILALHAAGKLTLTRAEKGQADPDDGTGFVDCTGQPHLWMKDFPFQDLVSAGAVSQATVRYRNSDKTMAVPGLAITDRFRAVRQNGRPHPGLFIMAVPYIGGFNPDYSGLDFCEDASTAIVADLADLA